MDLEAAEFYIRTSMLALGASVLEKLLHDVGVGRQEQPRLCNRGHLPRKMESCGVRQKTIQTILGPVRFARSRYVCLDCGAVEYPGDELLGVEATGFSPGLRRLMTRAGSREAFGEAAQDLQVYGAIHVGAKDVERVAETVGRQIDDCMVQQGSAAMLRASAVRPGEEEIPILYVSLDGTGAPMRKSELVGTPGKGADKKARTKEVKLGAVFTQTAVDEEGFAVRDPESTSYVGAIEGSEDFGHRLYAEAVRRGLARAAQVVVLSDGAEYNATIAHEHFPTAPHILDFYHASQRLSDFIKLVTKEPVNGALHQEWLELLEEGRIEALLEGMRQRLPRNGARRKEGRAGINYFAARIERMRYAEFRRQGYFIGSGVIEAGCKTLIGKRLKQSGMFWSMVGANAIIAIV